MKRIGKWVLIALALIVGALAVLFIAKPRSLLVAAILLTMLFNPGPPPIAEGQITSNEWMHWEEGGRKLTAVLKRRFPNGTPESDLKSVLLKQGFRPIPPPPADCLPPGQTPPVGVIYRTCLTADQKEKLERTLDNRHDITEVQGSYNGACL